MSFNNIIVSGIQMHHTAEYIANVFWSQNIAQIKSIILTPYLYNSSFYQTAYIHIESWGDSEAAYNFIKRLQNKQKITKIVHNVEDWWPVAINTMEAKTLIKLYQYSGKQLTTFDNTYYNKDVDVDIEEIDREIAIEIALLKSGNVTLRKYQQSFVV